ncbi:hypothetical protein [Methylobacterium nonmethylotrophicum]|uniref:DUF1849 domain-containing protein n=1 Tax=Methylobacterium nonmethylotrophicum TaxID=1141884 RepID=A0A4Z0NER6_9HYPH|nr:hypothetical protein [Methylobacterium nonmethylotrophicum]TGD93414.1 hypothetical protein EU555_33245 [Methylobacterium nonmethylotrophicum]
MTRLMVRGATALVAMLLGASAAQAAAAPRFADFRVRAIYAGPTPPPVLDTADKRLYRTRLIDAARTGKPNFAGEFILTTWGCGTSCETVAVISARTGEVFYPPFRAMGGETLQEAAGEAPSVRIETRVDSRLLVLKGRRHDDETADARHYYTFDGRTFAHVVSVPGAGRPAARDVGGARPMPASLSGRGSRIEDLARGYTWTTSSDTVEGVIKLGLQPRDRASRMMSYERVFVTCDRTRRLAVSVWPVASAGPARARTAPLTITADAARHRSDSQTLAYNEMDEAWGIDATLHGLGLVQDMVASDTLRLEAQDVALILPRPNAAVARFLSQCEALSRQGGPFRPRSI